MTKQEVQDIADAITELGGLQITIVQYKNEYRAVIKNWRNRDVPVFYGSLEKIAEQLVAVKESLEYWKDVFIS